VQKNNSHYAPQPYTNQSVFKSLLNLQDKRDKWNILLFNSHVKLHAKNCTHCRNINRSLRGGEGGG